MLNMHRMHQWHSQEAAVVAVAPLGLDSDKKLLLDQ